MKLKNQLGWAFIALLFLLQPGVDLYGDAQETLPSRTYIAIWGKVTHPSGLTIETVEPGVLIPAALKIHCPGKTRDNKRHVLARLGYCFKIENPYKVKLMLKFSFRLYPNELSGTNIQWDRYFMEVFKNENKRAWIIPAEIREVNQGGEKVIIIETTYCLLEKITYMAPGCMVTPQHIYSTFHPTPHYFKMGDYSKDNDGNNRLAEKEDGSIAVPQSIYPQCLPTGKASLYGAHQVAMRPEQRKWHIGTPLNPYPTVRAEGDYFSSTVGGTMEPSIMPLQVRNRRIGEPVNHQAIRFILRPGIPNEQAIEERGELIKRTLLRIVGGEGYSPGIARILARPVYIFHSYHGWNIIGVDKEGFWSHSQNPASKSLNDWCRWKFAHWIYTDERTYSHYTICYLPNIPLKPEAHRMGSFSMLGSGGTENHVQFIDLPSGKSIDWTPIMRGSPAGYLWIEDNCLLESNGIPRSRSHINWDDDLGFRIPVPANNFGACSCQNMTLGCRRCRLLLQLPFWVHNLCKDEPRDFEVDLFFWRKQNRWERITAQWERITAQSPPPNPDGSYPGFWPGYEDNYSLPGPLPLERFTVKADIDTNHTVSRGGRYNWQPVTWWIVLRKQQLAHDTIHGIKIVLRSKSQDPHLHNKVQDIVQIFFKTKKASIIGVIH